MIAAASSGERAGYDPGLVDEALLEVLRTDDHGGRDARGPERRS